MTSLCAYDPTIIQWKHPSKELISSIGLSDNQWLVLKRSILLLPHQYHNSHHPLLTPIIVVARSTDYMTWYPLLNKVRVDPLHDDIDLEGLQRITLQTSRSYHMAQLLLNNLIMEGTSNSTIHTTTPTTQQRQDTVVERLSWTIGCSEEQFIYMCTLANDQHLLPILGQHLQRCETLLNGRALMITYGTQPVQHQMIWYAPFNIVVPIFPFPPSSTTPSTPLPSSSLTTSSKGDRSNSACNETKEAKLGPSTPRDHTWMMKSTTTIDGMMNNVIEMSVGECRQWIGHIGWISHDNSSTRWTDQLFNLGGYRNTIFRFRRVHDGEIVTLIPTLPSPTSATEAETVQPDSDFFIKVNNNGRQLAVVNDSTRVVLIYEANDIVNFKASATITQPSPVRTLSLPWLTHSFVKWLGNYWITCRRAGAQLYTLEGKHIYTWADAVTVAVPAYQYNDNIDISDNDGYFLLKVRLDKGRRLYAYNIAKVIDLIASSPTSPPSNGYMLSNALASWSLDDIGQMIWLSIPNHRIHSKDSKNGKCNGNGMIAIQSPGGGSIRIYSVPSYGSL
jgi:hypothetical protein